MQVRYCILYLLAASQTQTAHYTMASVRRTPSTTKKEDESLAKELTISQSLVGEVTDFNDKKLKFKIDCWLMPLL
jgi:hypothetical protein